MKDLWYKAIVSPIYHTDMNSLTGLMILMLVSYIILKQLSRGTWPLKHEWCPMKLHLFQQL